VLHYKSLHKPLKSEDYLYVVFMGQTPYENNTVVQHFMEDKVVVG
jgi:hypothetical protein